jgi:uncharacterized protein
VEFDEHGEQMPFTINSEEWGSFLCQIFDEWYQRDKYRVSIRLFDAILNKMVQGTATVCHMERNCCQYFVVEHNGDVYPCDFFVEEPLKLGNIMDDSWMELIRSKTYKSFGAQKTQWNKVCRTCDHLDLCSGDCLKHRLYIGNPPQNLSYLCTGWKRFYDYTRDRFEKLAVEISRQHNYQNPEKPKKTTVGRNDPCPCGSGLKFKKCCGA